MNYFSILLPLLTILLHHSSYAKEANIVFTNGDKLKGSIEKLSNNQIHLKHDAFKSSDGTQPFFLDRIKSLTFSKKEKSAPSKFTIANLTMFGRLDKRVPIDIYKGTVKKINEHHVVIETPYAGEMNIKKPFINKLDIHSNASVILRNLGDLKDWKKSQNSNHIFQKNGVFFFPPGRGANSGSIFRKFDYPEIFQVSSTVKLPPNSQNSSINLVLFSDENGTSFSDTTALEVNVTNRKVTATLQSKNSARIPVADLNMPPSEQAADKWVIKVYTNLKKRKLSITINDNLLIENADMKSIDIENLGDHFSFFANHYRDTTQLTDLSIKKWNGILPGPSPEKRIPLSGQVGEAIKLQTGDTVYGIIEGIDEGIAKVKTKYGTYRMRVNKISSIKIGENNEILMQENDALLKFTDGSSFIVKIVKIEEGKVFGTSQVFEGVQGFDIEQITSMDFQNSIYQ